MELSLVARLGLPLVCASIVHECVGVPVVRHCFWQWKRARFLMRKAKALGRTLCHIWAVNACAIPPPLIDPEEEDEQFLESVNQEPRTGNMIEFVIQLERWVLDIVPGNFGCPPIFSNLL